MRSSIVRGAAAFAVALVFSVLAPAQASAQMPLHIVAGPNLGTISSDDFDDAESKIGFFAGVGTSLLVGETVAVSPYLAYVQKGAEFDGEDASYDYIEIPVLISTWFPVGESMELVVFGGPQLGFQINCDEAGFDCTEFEDHKSTEFGALAGAGLSFPMGNGGAFGVSLGADVGFTDLYDSVSYKTRTFFLALQYSTWLGGAPAPANGM